MLENMTREWSADRKRRQTCGKGQERELHPDDLLKRKKTGDVLGGLAERMGAGTGTLAMVGVEHTK